MKFFFEIMIVFEMVFLIFFNISKILETYIVYNMKIYKHILFKQSNLSFLIETVTKQHNFFQSSIHS